MAILKTDSQLIAVWIKRPEEPHITGIADIPEVIDISTRRYLNGEAVPDFRNPTNQEQMTMPKSKKPYPKDDAPMPMGKGKGQQNRKRGKC